MEMVTIPKKEYDRLKALDEEVDWDAVESFERSLADIKAGRVREI